MAGDSDKQKKTKKSKKGRPRGRKGWVPPYKTQWLEGFHDRWEESSGTGGISKVYDEVTTKWIRRFGYDLPIHEDPEDTNGEDVLPGRGDKVPTTPDMSDEEVEQKVVYYKDLRAKIVSWFHHHYNKITSEAMKEEAEKLIRIVQKQTDDSPAQVSSYHYYQTLYYKEKMLDTFNERYERAVADAERDGKDKPLPITIRQQVVKEFWDREPPEEKARVKALAQEWHKQNSKELDVSPPTNGEDFECFIANVAPFVGAFSEALHIRTGLMVSVMLTGPIPSDNGRIGVRSFHFGDGTDADEKPRWPQFDPAGFETAEKSLCALAATIYTPAECARRALGSEPPPQDSSTARASTSDQASGNPRSGRSRNLSPRGQSQPEDARPSPSHSRSPSPSDPLSRSSVPPRSPTPPRSPVPPRSPTPPRSQSPTRSSSTQPAAAPEGGASATLVNTVLTSSRKEAAASSTHTRPRPRPKAVARSNEALQKPAVSTSTPSAPRPESSVSVVLPPRPATPVTSREDDDFVPYTAMVDADCPSGLLKAYQPLVEAPFNTAWRMCVRAFVKQQIAASFADPTGKVLPPGPRPPEFERWFKYRRASDGPSITSYPDFLTRLSAWWYSMQPEVRGATKRARPVESTPTDWAALIQPGKLGIYLVVCGLYWIGRGIYIHGENSLQKNWRSLVDDVTWVLNHEVPPPAVDSGSDEESSTESSSEQPAGVSTRKRSSGLATQQPAKRARR